MRIKTLIAAVGALALLGLTVGPAQADTTQPEQADAQTFTVSGSSQWMSTNISIISGESIEITASGSWSPGLGYTFGPDGGGQTIKWPDNFLNLADIGVCAFCATTATANWGALIGYIGSSPPAPRSYTNTSITSEAEKVFFVGSQFTATASQSGVLWLNFNDDAYSGYTADNSGQVSATATVSTPDPVKAILTGLKFYMSLLPGSLEPGTLACLKGDRSACLGLSWVQVALALVSPTTWHRVISEAWTEFWASLTPVQRACLASGGRACLSAAYKSRRIISSRASRSRLLS
jgi:hypothetical protein